LEIDDDELHRRVKNKLFFCGAGTWQSLWSSGGSMGFGGGQSRTARIVDRIAADQVVPPELLNRFSWPPLILSYPDAEETKELFSQIGLTRLAQELGIKLDPATHDWTRGGMRGLESLAGEMLLRKHHLLSPERPEVPAL
jgi:hypothetical protein